jgi:hypothetical protein
MTPSMSLCGNLTHVLTQQHSTIENAQGDMNPSIQAARAVAAVFTSSLLTELSKELLPAPAVCSLRGG